MGTIIRENAKTLASMDADAAAEIANYTNARRGQCSDCARDFHTLCPQAWSPFFGGMCVAPKSYNGPCPPTAYFNAMSASDKTNFETRCSVCWPCQAAKAAGDGGQRPS